MAEQAHDQKHTPHEEEGDDITSMMMTIGALLLASMVIGYFVAV